MIYGIGTDIIEVARIRSMLERHGERARNRLLTEAEQAESEKFSDPAPHIAGRFAAKEAVLKALGTGLIGAMTWHDIEIQTDPHGRPTVTLSGEVAAEAEKRNIARIHLSISHTAEYATAQAVAEISAKTPPHKASGDEPGGTGNSINK
ncbi:MAG: holo-ACP synthase [Planctomycetota bacterium]|nr:MAG: holo-ACP synthase [Planctomycetota bacterium]